MKTFWAGVIASLWLVMASGGQTGGGIWQDLAQMPTARQELATAVLNGKIYVIGGYDKEGNSTDAVEVYNPSTNTWASAHPIPIAQNHNSAAVAAGKLYSFGGASPQTYVYDPSGDSWSEVAMMNFPTPAHLRLASSTTGFMWPEALAVATTGWKSTIPWRTPGRSLLQ